MTLGLRGNAQSSAGTALLCLALLCLLVAASAGAEDRDLPARQFVASVQPSAPLQAWLDETVTTLVKTDQDLASARLGVALLDLTEAAPRLAHHRGDDPFYPASVVKFVYLMASFRWQEDGRLTIDDGLRTQLVQMAYVSSNRATQQVFARLTDTTQGPDLASESYAAFRHRRHGVKRWLEGLGITALHCVHPTYDGGDDLFGRDVQFLRDETVAGGLGRAGEYPNRQAMTANATAVLLGFLARDLALTKASGAEVRAILRRDPAAQPYQARRIAGGAMRRAEVTVASKSGTWGPIFADAGLVTGANGQSFALAVFIERSPGYRGDFIAELADLVTSRLLVPSGEPVVGPR